MRTRTAIVILNWNTKDYLKKFLPNLLHSIQKPDEVIVVDNASTDGSQEFMKQSFPEVKLIEFSENYGFTGGYNKAFEQIDSEYFLLINSDIEVEDGWLEPLVETMENNPEVGACGPKLLSYFDRSMFEYAGAAGGILDKWGYPFCRGRILKKVEKDNGQYDSPTNVFWATGACLLVRSSLYKKLGGLDNRFFAHMEEIDLCWRLQLEGYKIRIEPKSVVYHLGGGTLPNTSPFKLYLNFRNNLLLLENNLAKTYSLTLLRAFLENKGCSIKESSIKGCSIKESSINEEIVERIAKKAIRKAKRTIFIRKCFDGLSGIIYLMTGKLSYFKSVLKAHKDAKRLSTSGYLKIDDYLKIKEYIISNCANPKQEIRNLVGIYDGWIVPKAIFGNPTVTSLLKKIS